MPEAMCCWLLCLLHLPDVCLTWLDSRSRLVHSRGRCRRLQLFGPHTLVKFSKCLEPPQIAFSTLTLFLLQLSKKGLPIKTVSGSLDPVCVPSIRVNTVCPVCGLVLAKLSHSRACLNSRRELRPV